MKISDSKTVYKAPQTKMFEVNVQGIICQSVGTEKFGMSVNSYDDDDWE